MRRTCALLAGGLLTAATALSVPTSPAAASGALHRQAGPLGHFRHLVVIYEENHSFDNLYAGWGRVGNRTPDGRRAAAYAAHSTQVDQYGNPIGCLLQNDANLTTTTTLNRWIGETTPPSHPGPLTTRCSGTTLAGATFDSHFTSSVPFPLQDYLAPADATCPPAGKGLPSGILANDPQGLPGGCTRDLVHRFYQEQYQLDGGKQDRYPTASDAAGLTQGYYDTRSLPVYRYLHGPHAPKYVVADHFFQAAFGGSFLNHQYLVAARPPRFPGDPGLRSSVLDAAGLPSAAPLYRPDPTVAYRDAMLTKACSAAAGTGVNGLPVDLDGLACGSYAVNTMQPSWQPTGSPLVGPTPALNVLPGVNDTDPTAPGYQANLGDELSAAGVSWGWYSGGWDNAAGNVGAAGWTNGSDGATCTDPRTKAGAPYPYCADALFQFHHQPLNYFTNYAPGQPGRTHLRDETQFLGAADAGQLPAVSFVKPVGEENEHPGYASTESGESHLVDLLTHIENGPQARDTLVLVTYDEFGGQWDHVSPPGQGNTAAPADQYGPGTRIPALLLGRALPHSTVDSTSYDTTSVLATIEREYGLAPLSTRDRDVADLHHALRAAGVHQTG